MPLGCTFFFPFFGSRIAAQAMPPRCMRVCGVGSWADSRAGLQGLGCRSTEGEDFFFRFPFFSPNPNAARPSACAAVLRAAVWTLGPVRWDLKPHSCWGLYFFFRFPFSVFAQDRPRRPCGGAATFIEAMRCCRDDMEVVGGILSGGWLTGLRLGRLQSDFEPACPPHACQPPLFCGGSLHLQAPQGTSRRLHMHR